ncbi:hypothetical protein SDJN03_08534, partial [Cucurbita argyrosperma subsp. sororia]
MEQIQRMKPPVLSLLHHMLIHTATYTPQLQPGHWTLPFSNAINLDPSNSTANVAIHVSRCHRRSSVVMPTKQPPLFSILFFQGNQQWRQHHQHHHHY